MMVRLKKIPIDGKAFHFELLVQVFKLGPFYDLKFVNQ